MIQYNTERQDIERIIGSLPKDAAVGEFSGRDSVAAIIKALERDDINDVLPVATFAGTEYGHPEDLFHNHEKLVEKVTNMYGDSKRIHELIVYSNPELWSVINGRFVTRLVQKFGFYNPCIGCHAYFHIVRLPIAARLGRKIIAGERELHDRRIKVNQLPQCLDTYKNIIEYFDVELVEPLRKMHSGEEVEKLIGWDWKESSMHPECVYSGNYTDSNGSAIFNPKELSRFLDEFLYPVGIELARLIMEDENVSRKDMIRAIEAII